MVILGIFLERFSNFLRTEEGKSLLERADSKKKLIQSLLAKDFIDNLTEEGFTKIFSELDSMPREQSVKLAQTLLSVYGLLNVRELLKYLLYGDDPLEERYDSMKSRIPELNPLTLTEIATYAAPRDFCVWDADARATVRFIGQSRMHGLSERAFTDDITGWDYVACKIAMNHLREQLRAYLQRRVDFVDTHLFTRYMKERVMRSP